MVSEPPEIIVLDADGAAEPLPPERPPRGSGADARRWGALLIGALLVFGVGFAVGRNSGYDTGYDATLADAPTGSDAPSSSASSAGMTSSSGPATTGAPAASATAAGTAESAPASSEAGVGIRVQTAIDLCGQSVMVGSVSGVLPLPAGADVAVVAGADSRVFDRAADLVTDPLVGGTADSDEYVTQLAASGDQLFGIVSSCADPGGGRFIEITHDASGFGTESIDAPVPKGAQVAGLAMGGSTPWATLYRSAGDDSGKAQSALLALDGSARIVELPAGFSPEAGYQNLVVGSLYPVSRTLTPQANGSLRQVFDVATGGVVRQLGTYAGRHVTGNGYVLWEPQCGGPCEIHRYDIVSGDDTVVGTAPDVAEETLAYWIALSPDGGRVAMVVPRGDVTGSASSGYQVADGFSVRVFDVATGEMSDGGGIEMTWPMASVAFSADSQWLLVAVPTRSGGSVLGYDADMNGPYRVATLSEVVGGTVPLAVLPPS